MCAEVELILIQISFLFFWRSLSFPKKNFKKNLWDQGKEGHKKDVIYIIREKGLIKTGSTPVSFPPKQAPKAESLTNKRAKLCSQTTVGWKCNLLVWLSEHSRNNNLQKSSQCMHEAKFSHIICDKKINLLKAFCRWVWRFFIQVIEVDPTFSSDSLIYQRSRNMFDMFIQAQGTRGSQWQGKTGRKLSSEAPVMWPPSGFLILEEL